MAEQLRALGYICPECGKAVYGERTRFAMSASAVGLVCACGRSELTAQPDGLSYRLTVPCGLCGGEHRAEAAAECLLEGEGVGFACPKTRQLCCYIGQPRRVERALRQLELTAEKAKENGDGAFVDSVIMYEVLSELRDIAARGGISCTCGSKDHRIKVGYSSIEIQCDACGSKLRLPAATDEDLEDLCCKSKLLLGEKGGN